MTQLSPKQKKTYVFIENHITDNGFCPTIREIADHLGISVNATRDKLEAVRRRGLVEWEYATPRTIRTKER